MTKPRNARLILENGTEFSGQSFGFPRSVAGEVVFNTAMTGYPESLTDPSYKGQILVSTFPLIGNYGVPSSEKEQGILKHFESDKIHISGLVISDYSFEYSHWNAENSLGRWLSENKIPAIFGIDTRALTKVLRENGCMLGKIVIDDTDVDWYDPNKEHLVDQVSIKEKIIYGKGKYKIMLVDCGVKYNIIRSLLNYDTTVIRVPWNYDYFNDDYDGLFISNGPGDPAMCKEAIENLSKAMKGSKPIFGICLGSQLLGIASGAETFKLKYGHRSHNQPVIEVGTNKCYITSQNHGFAVDHTKLKGDWLAYFLNLNDDTCEGIQHKTKPIFATQFHPEASGGPTDTAFLFERFIDLIKTNTMTQSK
ncbi:MAG: glutamine-hydrolyzing carbamoyl-phosphate synthase small subunit [Salinivirgaceae bacterium]|nr:glutamine-hydrolyzing carbamoyl-phosphate synthase small subunit [Salinivirgaceae bacterium]